MGEMRNSCKFLVGKFGRKRLAYLRILDVGRLIILKYMLKKETVRVWTGFNWL
jgi:hypothetical protein